MTSRRDFLKVTGAICCGAAALGSILESCTPVKYVQASVNGSMLNVPLAELESSKFIIVRSEKTEGPIYLTKTGNSEFHASLMICTHKHCELKPTGTFLTCPCHGSEFSNTGKVLKEPADKDLMKYKVTFDTTSIYIHLQ